MYLSIVGDRAVMQGWFARAVSLLTDEGPCPETGWVSLNKGMFESDRVVEGAALPRRPRARSPVRRLVARVRHARVPRREPGPRRPHRWRACCSSTRPWPPWRDAMSMTSRSSRRSSANCSRPASTPTTWTGPISGSGSARTPPTRRNLPAVAAFCRTHYGGLLTAAGRWGEADEALSDAVELWGLGHSSLRPGALVRLADLRVRQGRFEEAEQLLRGLDGDSRSGTATGRSPTSSAASRT